MCIANVADAMLSRPSQREDGRLLAHLLFELMEPGSYMADPSTLTLRNPKKWSTRINAFLEMASRSSLSELEVVSDQPVPKLNMTDRNSEWVPRDVTRARMPCPVCGNSHERENKQGVDPRSDPR